MVEFHNKGMNAELLEQYGDLVAEDKNRFVIRYHKSAKLDKMDANLKLCFGYGNLFTKA